MKAVFVVRYRPVALCLCLVVAVAALASAQTDPHVGTWKLNSAKSTFTPGPGPQSGTFTYEADGQGLTLLTRGADAKGKAIESRQTLTLDGREHPTPNPAYDTSVLKRTNASSYEIRWKKAGKVVQTTTNVVSKDGKTMTVTSKGTTASGQVIHNVAVFDKQ